MLEARRALKFRAPDGNLAEIVGLGRYKKKDKSKKSRIVHLALKVQDLEKATKFYENVFGFKQLNTVNHPHHVSRHMTDGDLDLALMTWSSDEGEEAGLAGLGPRIHHWGLEVVDRDALAETIKQQGGEILSQPGANTLRFRAPDHTIVEVVSPGTYRNPAAQRA